MSTRPARCDNWRGRIAYTYAPTTGRHRGQPSRNAQLRAEDAPRTRIPMASGTAIQTETSSISIGANRASQGGVVGITGTTGPVAKAAMNTCAQAMRYLTRTANA